MNLYYQHVGKEMFDRDAPVSIGLPNRLRQFSLEEVRRSGRFVEVNHGCQIWGLPSGAATACSRMSEGDYLMLLKSTEFQYIGKIVYRWPEFRDDLSLAMWGEGRFPIIVALEGVFINLPWKAFVEKFGFAENYYMRGNTMSLARSRMSSAGLDDATQVFTWISQTFGVN